MAWIKIKNIKITISLHYNISNILWSFVYCMKSGTHILYILKYTVSQTLWDIYDSHSMGQLDYLAASHSIQLYMYIRVGVHEWSNWHTVHISVSESVNGLIHTQCITVTVNVISLLFNTVWKLTNQIMPSQFLPDAFGTKQALVNWSIVQVSNLQIQCPCSRYTVKREILVAIIFGGFENITIWLRFNLAISLKESGWGPYFFQLVTTNFGEIYYFANFTK